MTFNTELWNGQAPKAGGYAIERSLRFNSADSAYLNRTPASAGNRKTWTWAGWVKLVKTEAVNTQIFIGGFTGGGATQTDCQFRISSLSFDIFNQVNNSIVWRLVSSAVFRDPSAWYHFVITHDTTDSTAADRVKVYVNGTRIENFSTASYPSLNYESQVNTTNGHRIGSSDSGGSVYLPMDGYLADIHFIDGQALDPTSFGEFDATTGIWNPIEYTGSYGTNGFHLDFSDNSTAAALGTDTSGNSNTWTVNNISVAAGAGNDSLVDVPQNGTETDTGLGDEVRGNYATLNPLKSEGLGTFSNGNLEYTQTTNGNETLISTLSLSGGSWYWEVTPNSSTNNTPGISPINEVDYPGYLDGFGWELQAGCKNINGNRTCSQPTATTGDVIGFAYNSSIYQLRIYKNGTEVSFSPVTVTSGVEYFAAFGTTSSGGAAATFNFGQRPFAYTAPSGFKALCTANLDAPVVTKPSEYMDVVTYLGNSGTQTISGLDFSPDLIWIKRRNSTAWHFLFDIIRGTNKALFSNDTLNEVDYGSGYLDAFTSDGFTLGSNADVNGTGGSLVAWTWDAGSSTVSNTDGSITSTVRANPSAGFSIVSYTGPGSSATIGHGLNAAPEFIIAKNRDYTDPWAIYHVATGANKLVYLDTSAASTVSGYWGSGPTSSVFGIGNYNGVARSGDDFIAYCFAPVDGYSSFGSYTGNGSADGPFVYTGFRPRYLLIKASSATGTWIVRDTARDLYNSGTSAKLAPNYSYEENNSSFIGAANQTLADFLSNGFKVRSTGGISNDSGVTYIYAAFAESPFQYARAR